LPSRPKQTRNTQNVIFSLHLKSENTIILFGNGKLFGIVITITIKASTF